MRRIAVFMMCSLVSLLTLNLSAADCSQCVALSKQHGPIPPGTYCVVGQMDGYYIITDGTQRGRVPQSAVNQTSCSANGGSSGGPSSNPGDGWPGTSTGGPTGPGGGNPGMGSGPSGPGAGGSSGSTTGSGIGSGGSASGSVYEKHFMIQAQNYSKLSKSKNYPLFVYGFATDPALKSNGGNVKQFIDAVNVPAMAKMLIFSSAATAERELAKVDIQNYLHNAGIEWIGYNQEGDKTPASEFSNPHPAVIRFAKAAQSNGFKFIWGPIRHMLDSVPANTIQQMCAAGMSGIAIQEQNQVSGDGSNRIGAVQKTINNYKNQCGNDFYTTVQIMNGKCQNSCRGLVTGIKNDTESISVWASGSEASALDGLLSNISFFLQ